MQICGKNKCTACGMCQNICPASAVSFVEDELGALVASVDETKCTKCGLCQKRCPSNNQPELHYPIECHAAYTTNLKERAKCASGGIATLLSKYVIKEKGGVVFGSRYDDNFKLHVAYTESEEGVEAFKGSKYIYSEVGADTYKKAQEFLENGRHVLFIGTPCQIGGLRNYLCKDYPNLITADLICHGTTPDSYFQKELAEIKKRYGIGHITNIRFRGNDNEPMTIVDRVLNRRKGNDFRLTIWEKDRCLYRKENPEDIYFWGFISNITLRENCYLCRYATTSRIADITLADYIGLGTIEKFEGNQANASCVLLNTDKGKDLYEALLTSNKELLTFKRKYEERQIYEPSLITPSIRSKVRDKFIKAYQSGGYEKARNILKRECLKNKLLRVFVKTPWHILHLPFYAVKNFIKIGRVTGR